jgi:uncharacterized membrane protein
MVDFINLFAAGLLAGAEVVVRYGVRDPLTVLDEQPQIVLRQALIRRLRILVPVLFGLTLVSGVAVAVVDGAGPGAGFRWAALLALLAWTLITFTRTAPINKALVSWSPTAPPADWRDRVDRWERLNTLRAWAALAVFACFTIAAALNVHSRP